MAGYKLLNPYIDFVFKKIFASETNANKVLLNLINEILKDSKTGEIAEIEIKNPNIDKDSLTDKASVLDIKAKAKSGEVLNIEIQVQHKAEMLKRLLYYWAKVYEDQISSGEMYTELERTICICIMKEKFDDTNIEDKLHHTWVVCDKESKEQITDIFEMHVIELSKLKKMQNKNSTPLRIWLQFIAGAPKEEWGANIMDIPGLQEAVQSLEYLSQNKEVREKAEQREKALKDFNTSIYCAEQRGREEGREKVEKKAEKKAEKKLK